MALEEEVLSSNTGWNCTSCYRCVVRCPRGIPVTYILRDLGTKTFGRTDERLVTARYYFSFGLMEGIKKGLENLKIAFGMDAEKDAALQRNTIRAEKLEGPAKKK